MPEPSPLRPQRSNRPALSTMCSQQDLRWASSSYSTFQYSGPNNVASRCDSKDVNRPLKRPLPSRPATEPSTLARSWSYSAADTSPRTFNPAASHLSASPRSRPQASSQSGSTFTSRPATPSSSSKTGSRPYTTPTRRHNPAPASRPSRSNGATTLASPPRHATRPKPTVPAHLQTPPSSPSVPMRPRSAAAGPVSMHIPMDDNADVCDFQLEASPASVKTVKPGLSRAAASFTSPSQPLAPHRSNTSSHLKDRTFYAAPVRLSPPKSPLLLPAESNTRRPSSPSLWPWSSARTKMPLPNYTEELFGPIIPAASFSQPVAPMPKLARSASMRSDSAVDMVDAVAEGELISSSGESSSTHSSNSSSDASPKSSFMEWKAYLKDLHERQPPQVKSDAMPV